MEQTENRISLTLENTVTFSQSEKRIEKNKRLKILFEE
jgi:hypothetical protein